MARKIGMKVEIKGCLVQGGRLSLAVTRTPSSRSKLLGNTLLLHHAGCYYCRYSVELGEPCTLFQLL